MRKKIVWIIVGLVAALYLAFIADNFYKLITKSYYINENNLCKVDTFHLRNRAYERPTANSNLHSPESELIFESTNKYSFTIDREIFSAIKDKKKLEDTFMYHETKFTVYSDTASCRRYKESKNPIFIRVYQLQIGDEKYIDVHTINEYTKSNIQKPIILTVIFVLFFTFVVYKDLEKRNIRMNRKVIFWCIFLPITALIITLFL